jgi:hypothetical protein
MILITHPNIIYHVTCLKFWPMLGNFQQLGENHPGFQVDFTLNPISFHQIPYISLKPATLIQQKNEHHENMVNSLFFK